MKTNKFLTLLLVVIAVFAITSCVEDDDYAVPSSLGDEENARLNTLLSIATEITMAEAKEMYSEGDFIEAVDTDIYIKGYVSSSDKTGNFFKEFFIQDSPSNPTIAIKVILNQVDTYNQFNFGREVYISLNGLFIGEERVGNGVITIGGDTETDQYGTTVTSLGQNQTTTHVLRSTMTSEMIPLNLNLSQIGDNHVGLWVQVDGVEFADNLNGERYYDPIQDFDTRRTLQACEGFTYSEFQLETSAFASFKYELLPIDNGSIMAVVSKTYDGSSLVLALNSLEGVNFNDSRCTPLDITDFSVIFEEDFNTAIDNSNLDLPGWTNFAEEGGELWTEQVFSGNGYAEFSGYFTGDDVNIGWLISPGINMDSQDNEFLNFKTAQHHLDSAANTLEVFVSTDYNGTDVLSATWEPIVASLATMSDSWYAFKDSGLIDISSYSGTLYVAYKVTGSGTDTQLDGAYHVEDFNILASN